MKPHSHLFVALLCALLYLLPLVEAARYPIEITFKGALNIPEEEDKSMTALLRVALSKKSFDWVSEEIEHGDIFELTLDEAGTIDIIVESVETGEDFITITAVLEEAVGWVQILYSNGRLCVMLCDYEDNENYHIVYNEIEDCYTLRVVTPSSPRN